MHKINPRAIAIIIIILLVLFLTANYLRFGVPHEFLSGEYKATFEGDYDFTLELVESIKHWQAFPSWSRIYSGPIGIFTANLHVFGQAFLYFFTHNLALSIKIYQVLYFILAGVSMLLLAEYVYSSTLVGLFPAILYMFSPFFIGEMLSYLHYTTTYFCLPLAYFLILKAEDSKSYLRFSLLAALVIAFNFLSHPQNFLISGIFYFLFALFIILFRLGKALLHPRDLEIKKNFIKVIKIFFIIGLVVGALCAFYLLPTFLEKYPYVRVNEAVSGTWLSPIKNFNVEHIKVHSQSLLSTITLQHWPWLVSPVKSEDPFHIRLEEYPSLIFMFIFALPFLLSSVGLFLDFNKRKKPIIFVFLALGIISLLLSMGTRAYILRLYSLAFEYIPFFSLTRTPVRFFYQAVLSICLLAGLVIARLPKRTATILAIIIIVPYIYAAKYYGNNYHWTFIPSEEPLYFSQVQNWLKDNNRFRNRIIETCGIPTYVGINQRMLPNGLDLLGKCRNKDYLDRFLGLFGFKYIVTPSLRGQRSLTFEKKGYLPRRADDRSQDTQNPEEYYSGLVDETPDENRKEKVFFYGILKENPNFKLHTAGTKDVAIFENLSAFENYQLYAAQGLMVLGGINAYDFLDLEEFQAYLKEGNPVKLAPVFIAQAKNRDKLPQIKQACSSLILHNTDALDLFAYFNQEQIISLSKFSGADWQFYNRTFACQLPVPYQDHSLGNFVFGDLSFADFTVTTEGKGRFIEIPLKIEECANSKIMLRLYGGENNGNIIAYLNNEYLKEIDTKGFRGFAWQELCSKELPIGNYILKLETADYKPVYLDSLLLVAVSELERGIDAANKHFADKQLIYIINKQNILCRGSLAKAGIYLGRDARYNIGIKVRSVSGKSARGGFNLSIDTKAIGAFTYSCSHGSSDSVNIPAIHLAKGKHSVILSSLPGDAEIELIALSEPPNSVLPVELKLNYTQACPNDYQGSIVANKPLILVFTETNYSGWRMKLGRKTQQPIITNMFLNGFIVDNPQYLQFRIFYSNPLQRLGLVVSLTTLICLLMYLIYATLS